MSEKVRSLRFSKIVPTRVGPQASQSSSGCGAVLTEVNHTLSGSREQKEFVEQIVTSDTNVQYLIANNSRSRVNKIFGEHLGCVWLCVVCCAAEKGELGDAELARQLGVCPAKTKMWHQCAHPTTTEAPDFVAARDTAGSVCSSTTE